MLKIWNLTAALVFLSMVCAHAETTIAVPETPVAAVPPGLNGNYALEIRPTRTITAVYTYTVRAPGLKADEWVLFAPEPPDFPGQKVLLATSTPKGESIEDLSPLKQSLLRARFPVSDEGHASTITLTARYRAELFSRHLIKVTPGTAKEKTAALTGNQRRLFLRRTAQFDHASPVLHAWMDSNRLTRGEKEGEVDFARRVYQMIVRNFQYEYLGNQDRSAAYVCKAGKSDCGGLAVLFATVLRSQGIPARTLAGRWAASAKPGEKVGKITYYQEHVKAEFFAQGVGWVPADLSSAILHDPSAGKLAFFGNDRGGFLTLHFDNDLMLDTLHFGVRTMPLLQKAAYWAHGSGTLLNTKVTESWNVTSEPATDR